MSNAALHMRYLKIKSLDNQVMIHWAVNIWSHKRMRNIFLGGEVCINLSNSSMMNSHLKQSTHQKYYI